MRDRGKVRGKALRELRDQVRVARMWVDAVCIDQDDLTEKGTYVAMEGKIYTYAGHTVIYLGARVRMTDHLLRNSKRF